MPTKLRHQVKRKLKRCRKSLRRAVSYYAWIVRNVPDDHPVKYQMAIHAKAFSHAAAELSGFCDRTEDLFDWETDAPPPDPEVLEGMAEDKLEDWIEILQVVSDDAIDDWREERT